MEKRLDARLDTSALYDLYRANIQQQRLKLLLIGEKGAGKTHLFKKARLPVHIDSFDNGGTKTLNAEGFIDGKRAIADVSWEYDDFMAPRAYANWRAAFELRVRNKYFDQFGTYVLDSFSLFQEAVIAFLLAQHGQKALEEGPKRNRDYNPLKQLLLYHIKGILGLPCDVIVTGHIRFIEHEEPQFPAEYKFVAPGQAATYIPAAFDEMWILRSVQQGRNTVHKRELLTQPVAGYPATTRIGSGKFDAIEVPDIKALLRKVGWNTDDKPLLGESENDNAKVERRK